MCHTPLQVSVIGNDEAGPTFSREVCHRIQYLRSLGSCRVCRCGFGGCFVVNGFRTRALLDGKFVSPSSSSVCLTFSPIFAPGAAHKSMIRCPGFTLSSNGGIMLTTSCRLMVPLEFCAFIKLKKPLSASFFLSTGRGTLQVQPSPSGYLSRRVAARKNDKRRARPWRSDKRQLLAVVVDTAVDPNKSSKKSRREGDGP